MIYNFQFVKLITNIKVHKIKNTFVFQKPAQSYFDFSINLNNV